MTPPLLRAPPFPWVSTEIAAVSAPGVAAIDTGDVVALLRPARVGGEWWAAPAPRVAEDAVIVRAASLAAAKGQAEGVAGPIVAVLHEPAPAPEGWTILVAPVDPWSLLAPGRRLIAPPGDEWRALAAIFGMEGGDDAALAAALSAAVYRDPFTAAPCGIERAIEILADWRRTLEANRAVAVATGMAWWKREAIGHFLWSGGAPVPIVDSAEEAAAAPGEGAIAVWPSRKPPGLDEAAARAGRPITRVEDGFIRSIGLGADLLPPYSIVVDHQGIYYDPTRPSDLETILAEADFPPASLARAAALRETIVTRGISKYGRETGPIRMDSSTRARRVVLVAGQVEDDASVRLGGADIAGNLDLLRRARAAEPDAHLLFKPHPDVDAGHRKGHVSDTALLEHADEIVRAESMAGLLARVDAVHVLTSLTGFEALLRGVEVITHGHPFFAGWGLTRDLAGPLPRRTRRLTLDALVAGTLIRYPRYLDPETNLPCPPEILLDRYARDWHPKTGWIVRLRRLQGRIARLLGRTTG